MATLKLIGAYRVSVSEAEQRFITEEVTGSAERTQEELGGLALLELEVRGAHNDFDLGSLHQVDSDQAPYDERYLTVDGLQMLGSDPPAIPDFRVCFYVHYFDPTKAISSPDGDLEAPRLGDMPERLSNVCVYEHPG